MSKSKRYKLFDSAKVTNENEDFGLWASKQVRNENAITFTGEMIVGIVVALCGAALAFATWQMTREEHNQFSVAPSHIGAWLTAIGLILIGIFLAHAGVIYWCRRLFAGKKQQPYKGS